MSEELLPQTEEQELVDEELPEDAEVTPADEGEVEVVDAPVDETVTVA